MEVGRRADRRGALLAESGGQTWRGRNGSSGAASSVVDSQSTQKLPGDLQAVGEAAEGLEEGGEGERGAFLRSAQGR